MNNVVLRFDFSYLKWIRLLRFEEITQQFSINKTYCGKLMPSSGVEARYNVISSNNIHEKIT